MARPDDIVGYTYQAETFCGQCLMHVYTKVSTQLGSVPRVFDPETVLDSLAAMAKIDRHNEETFDSDEFPKVVFRDDARAPDSEGNHWDRCDGCGEELINAV